MSLKVDNLDDPFINFQMDGALPVGYIYNFFEHPGITGGDGEIEINNINLSGLYSNMTSINNIEAVEMKGSLDFQWGNSDH